MKGRKYPLGIQTFERIIKGNYVYIDKTKLVYNLTPRQTAKAAASVQLAESSGVKREKIIHSTKELDEKFGKRERKGLFGFFKK